MHIPLHGHCGKTLAPRPGVVSFTLYLKVKYPSGDRIEELVGSQSMVRQCLIAAITHQPRVDTSTLAEKSL